MDGEAPNPARATRPTTRPPPRFDLLSANARRSSTRRSRSSSRRGYLRHVDGRGRRAVRGCPSRRSTPTSAARRPCSWPWCFRDSDEAAGDEVHPSDPAAAAATNNPGPYLPGVRRATDGGRPHAQDTCQLRRLVIGEVARFPDLARALYDNRTATGDRVARRDGPEARRPWTPHRHRCDGGRHRCSTGWSWADP